MTYELCASPWRGKVLTYSINPMCECPIKFDKILKTAKDLKLSKQNRIERVFVYDFWECCNDYFGWGNGT